MFNTKAEKLQFLKDFMAGKASLPVETNPLKGLDINNLPSQTIDDFFELKKCYDYAIEMHLEKEVPILFEGVIKAAYAINLIDEETEKLWRVGPHKRHSLFPVKASLFNKLTKPV
jgi:hypothetical protein